MGEPVLNHIGHCVTDLDRSVRFYTELLGFAEVRRMEIPDDMTAKLLSVEPPVGLTAAYLAKDGFTMELLHYARPGNPGFRPRVLNEPGLTHMSFCFDDLEQAKRRVVELGGRVEQSTDVGAGVFARDPDGQLIELLPMMYRRMVDW